MKITVHCENCGEEIAEEEANSFYINKNYLIVCEKCYNDLQEQTND